MAATTAVFMLFNSGDHVLITDDVYGGTYRVITKVLSRIGIEATLLIQAISKISRKKFALTQKPFY